MIRLKTERLSETAANSKGLVYQVHPNLSVQRQEEPPKRINPGLFSSKRSDWATPPEVFEPLNREFGFTLDVCANADNAKCPQYYSPADNSLGKKWQGVCYCNPPYGREIVHWVEKAYKSSLLGATVICLLPSRTDTQWWHKWVMPSSQIRFVQGRIRFVGGESKAPFPSVIVVYRPPQHCPVGNLQYELNVWGIDSIPRLAPWMIPHLKDLRMAA